MSKALELADAWLNALSSQDQHEAACAMASGLRDLAAVEQELDAVKAELVAIRALPVKAWGMPHPHGYIIDVITPSEHEREEGSYTVPLVALPQTPKE